MNNIVVISQEKEARREEKFRFTCKCSFLEIYNEQILDLLNPDSVNLQVRIMNELTYYESTSITIFFLSCK